MQLFISWLTAKSSLPNVCVQVTGHPESAEAHLLGLPASTVTKSWLHSQLHVWWLSTQRVFLLFARWKDWLWQTKTLQLILRLEIHHWIRNTGTLFHPLLTQTLTKWFYFYFKSGPSSNQVVYIWMKHKYTTKPKRNILVTFRNLTHLFQKTMRKLSLLFVHPMLSLLLALIWEKSKCMT